MSDQEQIFRKEPAYIKLDKLRSRTSQTIGEVVDDSLGTSKNGRVNTSRRIAFENKTVEDLRKGGQANLANVLEIAGVKADDKIEGVEFSSDRHLKIASLVVTQNGAGENTLAKISLEDFQGGLPGIGIERDGKPKEYIRNVGVGTTPFYGTLFHAAIELRGLARKNLVESLLKNTPPDNR